MFKRAQFGELFNMNFERSIAKECKILQKVHVFVQSFPL